MFAKNFLKKIYIFLRQHWKDIFKFSKTISPQKLIGYEEYYQKEFASTKQILKTETKQGRYLCKINGKWDPIIVKNS